MNRLGTNIFFVFDCPSSVIVTFTRDGAYVCIWYEMCIVFSIMEGIYIRKIFFLYELG